MTRRLTTMQARRDWANVLRTASRGTPVVVTRNGRPIAAVVSIEQLRTLERSRSETLGEVIRQMRSDLNVDDLRGPDPWADVRNPSAARDIDLRRKRRSAIG
jgi:prevent-host-death family protein